MGVVIINGQKYDSVSGLQIDGPESTAEPIETLTVQASQTAPKPRRQSKQERLAEAVAREFAGDESEAAAPVETTVHEVPDWIGQFIEDGSTLSEISEAAIEQPAWITNYVSGGDPIEIQPIGLEAFARDNAEEPAVLERAAPQNHRSHTPQHSSTLNRNFVQKPVSGARVDVRHRTTAPVATHPEVHRFAPTVDNHVETVALSETKVETEAPFVPVMTHSMEEKLAQRELAKAAPTSSDLRDALINEQLSQPIDHRARAKAERKAARTRRRFTAPTLITAALAILVLGGYFTYVSMPSISVRVAAARAGVDAHAPYAPNGYSIDGPVAYAPGRVTINYKSNGGGAGYSLTQQNNTWGDSVVTDTLVEGSNYTTLETGSVTVYRFGDQVAWVENGILFTLSGNGTLGTDQINRIVDSL